MRKEEKNENRGEEIEEEGKFKQKQCSEIVSLDWSEK